jgi:menaquinone-dependent protoporphyrinogen oxidase
MAKALIVYGTRYGATAMTSEEIADLFRQEGLDVKVVNLKDEKVKDISDYELVVVGSGIRINRWTKEPQKFLKKFRKELANKKVALFVCCGAARPIDEDGKDETKMQEAKTKYLDEKAAKYALQPVALGFFGGVYNFNKVSRLFRTFMDSIKPQLEAAGVPETEPGLYDTRDLDVIRGWAKELAQNING